MTPPPKKLPQPEMFSVLKRRGGMLAVCTLIVVAMGAYGGASLKTTVEKTQKVQKVREASLEERIYRLENYKHTLELEKYKLEGKIAELRGRTEPNR